MQALKLSYGAPAVSGTDNLTDPDSVTATQAGSGQGSDHKLFEPIQAALVVVVLDWNR